MLGFSLFSRVLVLTERLSVNPLEKKIGGFSCEHNSVATIFVHWFYSNEHDLEFDNFFWNDDYLNNDD